MKISIIGLIPLIVADLRLKRQARLGGFTLGASTVPSTSTVQGTVSQPRYIQDMQSAAQYYKISNEVFNHGCHCQGLQKKPAYGVPVDHKDFLCRSWSSARSCTFLKEGPCDGVVETAYDVSKGCGALNGCLKSLCEIDQNFQAMIRSENSTSITEPVCERKDYIIAKDSCCGSSPLNFQKFNSQEHFCEADKLMPLEAKVVVPDYIQKGLTDGKWLNTTVGNFIHIGEQSCSIQGKNCETYCQSLGVGSNFAVPTTAVEYESYYQAILDSLVGPKKSWSVHAIYGLLGTDKAMENMKFCSYQPYSYEDDLDNSFSLGSAINAELDWDNEIFNEIDKERCAIKFPQNYAEVPICVYNP